MKCYYNDNIYSSEASLDSYTSGPLYALIRLCIHTQFVCIIYRNIFSHKYLLIINKYTVVQNEEKPSCYPSGWRQVYVASICEEEWRGGRSEEEWRGGRSEEEGGVKSEEEGGVKSEEEGGVKSEEEGGVKSEEEGGVKSEEEGGVKRREEWRVKRREEWRGGRSEEEGGVKRREEWLWELYSKVHFWFTTSETFVMRIVLDS